MPDAYTWSRSPKEIPSQSDFEAFDGWLDQISAWEAFGELNLQQAYELFLTHPGYHQEAFMWMGPRAFQFYFPVIDRFLRSASAESESDDCEAWILGCGVLAQIEDDRFPKEGGLRDEVFSLASYVIQNHSKLALERREQKRICKKWDQILRKLQP